MPYHGAVSKYGIPASHVAPRAARAASSVTTLGKLPSGAQPKPAFVIGSFSCPIITRCVKSTVPLSVGEREVAGWPDISSRESNPHWQH